MDKNVNHQFSLFGFIKPDMGIPLTADQVKMLKEGRELNKNKNFKAAAAKMRDFQDSLERFERRLDKRKS